MTTTDLACHDAACAPPPVGTGGSKGGPSRGVLSPTREGRTREPQGRFSDLAKVSDADLLTRFSVEHAGYAIVPTLTGVVRKKGEVRLNLMIMDEQGNRVGSVIRFLREGDHGEIFADHDWFNIEYPSAQGKGLAQAFNDNALAQYQRLGVDRIELHAGLTVGPYAWARQGYRLKDPEGKGPEDDEHYRRGWVSDRLLKVRYKLVPALIADGKITKEEGDALIREAMQLKNASADGEDVQPIHVASLGQGNDRLHWDDGDMWPGKAVLIADTDNPEVDPNRHWHGVYYLEGRETPATVASAINNLLTRA